MVVDGQERGHEEDRAQRISMGVSQNAPGSYSWNSWIIRAVDAGMACGRSERVALGE
jgi:hypothetical protein